MTRRSRSAYCLGCAVLFPCLRVHQSVKMILHPYFWQASAGQCTRRPVFVAVQDALQVPRPWDSHETSLLPSISETGRVPGRPFRKASADAVSVRRSLHSASWTQRMCPSEQLHA